MNTVGRTFVFAIVSGLALATLNVSPAAADTNRLLLAPNPDSHLIPHPNVPRFGFSSFNINGVGERVTHVRFGGIASRFGLEPGDTVLSMNGHRLTYDGSWNDALFDAIVNHGGLVRLRIHDVRTGFIATRQLFVGGGGVGPITPHFHNGHNHNHFDGPVGPITKKSTIGPTSGNGPKKLNKIVELLD
jgi:hypothetical protein